MTPMDLPKTCYAAMPVTFYGSALQAKMHRTLRRESWEIMCPSGQHHQEGYREAGMAYFESLVERCGALCYLTFRDGTVSAGVGREVDRALVDGKPVFLFDGNTLVPVLDSPSRLSVDETRSRLKKTKEPRPGDTICVWFSCGAASAVAAAETLRLYRGVCDVRVVNNPVREEDSDNQRFLRDVEAWLRVPIESAPASSYPSCSAVEVWSRRQFMSGVGGAPCTVELKKKARQEYESRVAVDWHVLGFTSEEKQRYERFVFTERSNVLPVLIDADLDKNACGKRVRENGVALPRVYEMGYPNANCIGCVKASSPTYWNHVRNTHPEIFEERARQSREIGAKLVRVSGERIFLDELAEDAKGAPMKTMDVECGVFCEEWESEA